MRPTTCKHFRKPVMLLDFPSGARLWHHVPVIGVHDEAGLMYAILTFVSLPEDPEW
jgi:hypothetical protein